MFPLRLFNIMPGLPIQFDIEPLGLIFALIASGLWIVTHVYAMGYMRGNDEVHHTRFFACFSLAIFASIGIAFAGNLITLFLFYEVLTLGTYPLVAHKGTPEALKRGENLSIDPDEHVYSILAARHHLDLGNCRNIGFSVGGHSRRKY